MNPIYAVYGVAALLSIILLFVIAFMIGDDGDNRDIQL